jgi:hypothetical protein
MEARYVVSGRRAPRETGSGRIVDLSSVWLRFTADRPLLIGRRLDVSIDWPVLLDGGVQLQLILSGKVVRSNGPEIALQIERHEFKTRRSGQVSHRAAISIGPQLPEETRMARHG